MSRNHAICVIRLFYAQNDDHNHGGNSNSDMLGSYYYFWMYLCSGNDWSVEVKKKELKAEVMAMRRQLLSIQTALTGYFEQANAAQDLEQERDALAEQNLTLDEAVAYLEAENESLRSKLENLTRDEIIADLAEQNVLLNREIMQLRSRPTEYGIGEWRTRNGDKVVVDDIRPGGQYPLVGRFDGGYCSAIEWQQDGQWEMGGEGPMDIVGPWVEPKPEPEPRTWWVYVNQGVDGSVYSTTSPSREIAAKSASKKRLACVKITEWEGLDNG